MKLLSRAVALIAVLVLSACASYSGRDTSELDHDIAVSVLVERAGEDGHGSGTIVDADGLILTAAHVVGDNPNAVITLSDGTKLDGWVIAKSEEFDLALIDTVATDLEYAEIGDPTVVGQDVIIVGNPYDMHGAISKGHIAIAGFVINGTPHDLIHSNILPGNSGGGVFDLSGRLVGVITLGRSVTVAGPIPLMSQYPIGAAEPVTAICTIVSC